MIYNKFVEQKNYRYKKRLQTNLVSKLSYEEFENKTSFNPLSAIVHYTVLVVLDPKEGPRRFPTHSSLCNTLPSYKSKNSKTPGKKHDFQSKF